MENREHVIFIVLLIPALIAGIFASIPPAHAYYADTHSLLTQAAVDLYNARRPDQTFPSALASYLIDGARREDDIPRSLNHFYDPVYDRGLTYDASADPVNIVGDWEKSEAWAQDSGNQNSLLYKVAPTIASILSAVEKGRLSEISTETDFTWQKAIEYYAQGDREKAVFALGHVIHLIEDASVPDHTRNDPHLSDSSYENWTARFTPGNPDGGLTDQLNSLEPIALDSLNDYFDGIAAYSNNNFYSDDTIGIQSGYSNPTPNYFTQCGDYVCGIANDGNTDYKLFIKYRVTILNTVANFGDNSVLLSDQSGGTAVMQDYWSRLSAQAVKYSAGVLGLFLSEAEAASQAPPQQPGGQPLLAAAISAIGGAANSAVNTAQRLLSGITNAFSNQNRQSDSGSPSMTGVSDGQWPNLPIAPMADSGANNPDNGGTNGSNPDQARLQAIASELQAVARQMGEILASGQGGAAASSAESGINASSSAASSTATSTGQSGNPSATAGVTYGGGGGSQPRVYPKLLINEIQLSSPSSTHDEFVELYNPNDGTVDLTDWYVQKRTSGGSSFTTFAPKGLFEGKIIASRGYFIVSHPSSTVFGDVATGNGLASNNTIALKNPNGDIVDRVGWGEAQDCEGGCAAEPAAGESIQRKYSNGAFQDTDQNASDFEVRDCPSPRSDAQAICIIPEGSAVTSTATSAEAVETPVASTTSSTPDVVGGGHIVISEIMPGEDGLADSEWVELYNPTDSAVSLNGWALKKRSSFTTTSTDNIVAGDSFAGSIGPRGFFLVASEEWPGSGADVRYSTSRRLAFTEDVLVLYDDSGGMVDEVFYADIPSGASLERKANLTTGCAAASGEGEFSGNGCAAAGADAFDLRDLPNPQSSASLPEPRQAPTLIVASAAAAASSVGIRIEYGGSHDAEGSTSTISYRIEELSSGAVASATATTSFTLGVTEVGRDYHLIVQAMDRDGLLSVPEALDVRMPSPFTDLSFYQDPRSTSSPKYVLDAYYDRYPLLAGDDGMWEAVVFYDNQDPSSEEYFAPGQALSGATVVYPTCSDWGSVPSPHKTLVLPFGPSGCIGTGGGVGVTAFSGATEDKHFIVQINASGTAGFNAGDYVTTAFYRYDSGWRPAGFYLAAVDENRYPFSSGPAVSLPPNPPTDVNFGEFDSVHAVLAVDWEPATDPDTLDGLLRYETNNSTSSAFAESAWVAADAHGQTTVRVFPGNANLIGVRAVDDFGNASEPATKEWLAPADSRPVLHQGDSSVRVGGSLSGGQRLFTANSIDINGVEMIISLKSTTGGSNGSYLLIADDADGMPGTVVATSSIVNHEWWKSGELQPRATDTYRFDSPVGISGGSYFWLLHRDDNYQETAVYGSAGDGYSDGYWSNGAGDSGQDAYFYILTGE